MSTNLLTPNEIKLVPSIKMKLGDNQEFYCGMLSFLGTPGNTFGYFLDYLREEISNLSETSKKNQLLPSIHDKKLDALEDIIEASNGKPILVAYWFKSDLERIENRLKKIRDKTDISFEILDEPESIEKWNKGEISVGLIHPQSAGHGLNLQEGGNVLVWFSLTWSLELYQQTIGRLYRQGQKAISVVVIRIIGSGTIDDDVIKALDKKERTQDARIRRGDRLSLEPLHARVLLVLGNRQGKTAFTKAQALDQACLPAFLHILVLAHDADIRHAIGHGLRNIVVAQEQHLDGEAFRRQQQDSFSPV